MINVIIVDDEEPARAKLHRWLGSEPDIQITGEFGDGLSAARSIMSDSPDVVFLDIQMPGLGGLQVAAQLELDVSPLFVFVTAYDAHALAARGVNAPLTLAVLLLPRTCRGIRCVELPSTRCHYSR
jgi:two-component system, LytTR family, response regulator